MRLLMILVFAATEILGAEGVAAGGDGSIPGFFSFWLLPRVWVMLILILVGTVLLYKGWITKKKRTQILAFVFILYAIVPVLPILGWFSKGMAMHPSPMCILTKPLLFLEAGRSIPLIFGSLLLIILIVSIISNKAFCSWACPIGALQELVYRIPGSKKLKCRINFKWANTVRILLFLLYPLVFIFFGLALYDYVNPFEALHWSFEIFGLLILATVLVFSIFWFRPFCYAVCPMGLVTWLLEQFSLSKIRLKSDSCNDCNACEKLSPCPAIQAILRGERIIPDCHGCGDCLQSCSKESLKWRIN